MEEELSLTTIELETVQEILRSLYFPAAESIATAYSRITAMSQSQQKRVIESLSRNIAYAQRLRRDHIINVVFGTPTALSQTNAELFLVGLHKLGSIDAALSGIADLEDSESSPKPAINALPAEATDQLTIFITVREQSQLLFTKLYAKLLVVTHHRLLNQLPTEDVEALASAINVFISQLAAQEEKALFQPFVCPVAIRKILVKAQLEILLNKPVSMADGCAVLRNLLFIASGIVKNRTAATPLSDEQVVENLGLLFYLTDTQLPLE